MLFAPYGVFALLAALVVESPSTDLFAALAMYALTVLIGLALMIGVYILLVWVFTKNKPSFFINGIAPAQLLAFSTSSSAATLPVTMERVEEHMGVHKEVTSFVLPIGATINMDGTAIMQGVATVFIAQVYGVDLSLGDFLAVIITATLASIGTAGVPGVGLIMLAMVLQQVGLPVEGIALIIGVDRLLDMMRTAVNITGDAAATCVIAKSEGCLNVDRYTDPSAGLEAPKRASMPGP